MPSIGNYVSAMLGEGINIVLDSAKETGVEITTMYIAQELAKMKWAGKNDWTDKMIEAYIDNLRSNLQASIVANIIQRRIAKVQIDNYGYLAVEKIKQGLSAFLTRAGA